MKYIKTYENKSIPQIGNYIVTDDKYIAIVIDIGPYGKTIEDIEIRFLDTNFQDIISLKDINFITKYKSDAEIYLKAKKYNL